MIAFMFPGQGSQTVGMGLEVFKAFPTARDVFQEVDEALSQSLSKLIFDGPLEDLTLTANAQPALMAVSIAVMRVLEKEGGYMLGHSLGEYTALAALQSLDLSTTARLLRLRGQAMQAAVPVGQGGMAAILGGDVALAEAIAQEAAQTQICVVANDNAPGQVVLSGHKEALERAGAIALSKGVKRVIPLPVSAPFHSPLMEPAARAMKEALQETLLQKPRTGFIANVSAREKTDPAEIQESLVQQVTGRVRWRESILYLQEKGVATFIEVGAGRVLTGLNKRIAPDTEALALNTPEDIENFLKRS